MWEKEPGSSVTHETLDTRYRDVVEDVKPSLQSPTLHTMWGSDAGTFDNLGLVNSHTELCGVPSLLHGTILSHVAHSESLSYVDSPTPMYDSFEFEDVFDDTDTEKGDAVNTTQPCTGHRQILTSFSAKGVSVSSNKKISTSSKHQESQSTDLRSEKRASVYTIHSEARQASVHNRTATVQGAATLSASAGDNVVDNPSHQSQAVSSFHSKRAMIDRTLKETFSSRSCYHSKMADPTGSRGSVKVPGGAMIDRTLKETLSSRTDYHSKMSDPTGSRGSVKVPGGPYKADFGVGSYWGCNTTVL